MTVLDGVNGGVAFVQPSPAIQGDDVTPPAAGNLSVIDGTPVRVVMIALASAAGLFALQLAGFKFSITAST
jgi:hypothetical protein